MEQCDHGQTGNDTFITVNGRQVRQLHSHRTNPVYRTNKRQVFIIGSKGIPASYGGFETFVEKLTEYQVSGGLRYHVSRIGSDNRRYEYNRAKCFNISVPKIGSARAIYYDLKALKHCIDYCRARSDIKTPIFYVLACRIGPFIGWYKRRINSLGGKLYVNPDGHEWKRGKWPFLIKKYWKYSEKLMVKHADLVVCDSMSIQSYIKADYKRYAPDTAYIAYGAETTLSALTDDDEGYVRWLDAHGLRAGEYYLIVGRFVPENNYLVCIREYMRSSTPKDLAVITTPNPRFMQYLEQQLHFSADSRIKFTGTVYDGELLKKIRENAYGYIHGHEVGGTNPSLLEALWSTKINLLLDVGFNREVGRDSALYWSKETGDLAGLISEADSLTTAQVDELEKRAKARIRSAYSWSFIVGQYETLFLSNGRL